MDVEHPGTRTLSAFTACRFCPVDDELRRALHAELDAERISSAERGEPMWLAPQAIWEPDDTIDVHEPDAVASRRTFAVIPDGEASTAGFVRAEITAAGLAYVTVYIAPWARRRGAGTAALRFISRLPGVVALEAAVHPDNEAGLRCCAATGFAATGSYEGSLIVVGKMADTHQI